MRRTEVLQGLRRMKFEDVYGRWQGRQLSQSEAAEILGMSERTFRRWRDRYEGEGASGLFDRRLGQASARRVAADRVDAMLTLYREHYGGFTARHFHDKLVRRHGFTLGYTWTKLRLQEAGLVARAPRRSAHRKKRPRRPLTGMLLHQDGSRHRWLPAVDRVFDLIVTLDDATSAIYSAFLVDEEGTSSTFRALAEVIEAHGLPCALYTDRASHYFVTPKAGQRVARDQPTQVGRALAQLGIEHIAAYSPEARGRSERAFGTLQDRPCRRSCNRPASRRWTRPTATCARSTCPSTTPALRSRPSTPARRSWPLTPAFTVRSCASRRSGWSATTTACATATSRSRSRRAGCAHTS
jgi:transposase